MVSRFGVPDLLFQVLPFRIWCSGILFSAVHVVPFCWFYHMPRESGIKEHVYSRWRTNKTKNLLSSLGLITLYPKFQEERVDFNVILSAGDQDLIRLGLSPIDDRVRLRDACRRIAYNTPTISISSSNNVIVYGSSGSGLSTIGRSPYLPQQMFQRLLNASIQEERNALFTPRSNRRRRYNSAATASGDLERSSVKRKPGTKTWTVGFICLGDNHATRALTAIQK